MVYDEDGVPADEGYLVVEGPVPGMTRSLTGGDDRYLEEYWRDFEGVWNQNDWAAIDDRLGAPFRPAAVHVVTAIPRTQTGKVPRKVVRSTYLGDAPEDASTLERGEVLEEYPVVDETGD